MLLLEQKSIFPLLYLALIDHWKIILVHRVSALINLQAVLLQTSDLS